MKKSVLLFAALCLLSTLSLNASAQQVSTVITHRQVDGLAVDNAHTVYFSRWATERALYKLEPGGTPVLLSTDFKGPTGLVFDPAGDVIVSDKTHIDRFSTAANTLQVIAGSPISIQASVDGPAAAARFHELRCIARNPTNGDLYVCQRNHQKSIRKIDAAGMVSTFFESQTQIPSAVAVDSAGTVYFSVGQHYNSYDHTIYKVSPAGVASVFVGSGSAGYADGTGTAAAFNDPKGLAFDAQDNLYVADSRNSRIRKVTPAGVVSTYAGSGVYARVDGVGTGAAFQAPFLLAMHPSGTLYVAEKGTYNIRKIVPPRFGKPISGSAAVSAAATSGLVTPASPPPARPVVQTATAVASLPAVGLPSTVTCGQWGSTRIKYFDDVREIACSESYIAKRGTSLTFDINYNCVTNGAACVTTYAATLTQPNGASSTVPVSNNTQWTQTFTQAGTYTVSFGASCNGTACQNACSFSIVIQ